MKVYLDISEKFFDLTIEGYVIPSPDLLRNKLGPLDIGTNSLDFGNVFINSDVSEIISIFNPDSVEIRIRPLNESENIVLTVEPQTLKPEESGNIKIQLNTDAMDFGEIFSMCRVEITKQENIITDQLSILANVVEDFSTLTDWERSNPPVIFTDFSQIDLENIEPNQITTKEITLENRGKRDLMIRNIVTSNSMYSINPKTFLIEPGKKGIFQLSIKPTIEKNNLSSKLTIISNDPSQSLLSCKISGMVDQSSGNSLSASISEVSIEQADSLILINKENADFVVLDVRTKEEYNSGCLKNAVNLDYNNANFVKMLKLMDTKKTFLVYCASGMRSKKAVDQMVSMGFDNFYHMYEGIEGWKAERLELTDPNKLADPGN